MTEDVGTVAIVIGRAGLASATVHVVTSDGASVVLPARPMPDAVSDGVLAAMRLIAGRSYPKGRTWKWETTGELAERLFRALGPRGLVRYVMQETRRETVI